MSSRGEAQDACASRAKPRPEGRVCERGRRPTHIPTAAREVFDVTGAGDTVAAAPKTQYARSGKVHIAYQVVGDGPVDVVWFRGMAGDLFGSSVSGAEKSVWGERGR